jgi:hypothetical protein
MHVLHSMIERAMPDTWLLLVHFFVKRLKAGLNCALLTHMQPPTACLASKSLLAALSCLQLL